MNLPEHLLNAKICNKDTCEEIRTLKEELEKKNKKYWQSKCFEYQVENRKLNNILNELKEWFKEFHKYQSRLKWNEENYIEFIEHLENELKESDK